MVVVSDQKIREILQSIVNNVTHFIRTYDVSIDNTSRFEALREDVDNYCGILPTALIEEFDRFFKEILEPVVYAPEIYFEQSLANGNNNILFIDEESHTIRFNEARRIGLPFCEIQWLLFVELHLVEFFIDDKE